LKRKCFLTETECGQEHKYNWILQNTFYSCGVCFMEDELNTCNAEKANMTLPFAQQYLSLLLEVFES